MDYLSELIKATKHGKWGVDSFNSQQYKGYSLFSINSGYPALLVMAIKPKETKNLAIKNKVVKGKMLKPKRVNWLHVNTTNLGKSAVNFDAEKKTITFIDTVKSDFDNFPEFKKGTVIEFGKNYLKRIK